MLLTKEICRVDVEIAEVGGEQAVQPLWEPERQEPHVGTCCAFAVSIDTVPVLALGLCEPQTLC